MNAKTKFLVCFGIFLVVVIPFAIDLKLNEGKVFSVSIAEFFSNKAVENGYEGGVLVKKSEIEGYETKISGLNDQLAELNDAIAISLPPQKVLTIHGRIGLKAEDNMGLVKELISGNYEGVRLLNVSEIALAAENKKKLEKSVSFDVISKVLPSGIAPEAFAKNPDLFKIFSQGDIRAKLDRLTLLEQINKQGASSLAEIQEKVKRQLQAQHQLELLTLQRQLKAEQERAGTAISEKESVEASIVSLKERYNKELNAAKQEAIATIKEELLAKFEESVKKAVEAQLAVSSGSDDEKTKKIQTLEQQLAEAKKLVEGKKVLSLDQHGTLLSQIQSAEQIAKQAEEAKQKALEDALQKATEIDRLQRELQLSQQLLADAKKKLQTPVTQKQEVFTPVTNNDNWGDLSKPDDTIFDKKQETVSIPKTGNQEVFQQQPIVEEKPVVSQPAQKIVPITIFTATLVSEKGPGNEVKMADALISAMSQVASSNSLENRANDLMNK